MCAYERQVEGTVPLYRFYGDSKRKENHFYSLENEAPKKYRPEGISFYVKNTID